MEALKETMLQMITMSHDEWTHFSSMCSIKSFQKKDIIQKAGNIPNEVYFVLSGWIRVFISDTDGENHSLHFAREHQFISDYSSFIQQQPSRHSLQALGEVKTVYIPRKAIDWGYLMMKEGNKLGRLIAEFYFMYQDARISNRYLYSAKERYNQLTNFFPGIHQHVPQHMIASYLGITPIHLSRLKRKKS
jgi:CRP-like cAMP-binding protein